MHDYRAPFWLGSRGAVGGNVQTLWPALLGRPYSGVRPRYRRERWVTPDGDFIDVDWLLDDATAPGPGTPPRAGGAPVARAPLLVLFHGLEGSSSSNYALGFADWARRHGWHYVVPHFRGCSGEPNLAPRTYHAGDFEEVDWILRKLAAGHDGPLLAVGISLGGNALLRWAQESGETACRVVRGIAAVCAPLDLSAAGRALSRGFNRHVYSRMFLATLKPKALALLQRHPGLFDAAALTAARDLYEYDDVFTAPLHGFRGTEDYWSRASSKPGLQGIGVPALVLNPLNDPFIPAASLPRRAGGYVTLWQPATGGHVGFPAGRLPPGHQLHMPQAVGAWLAGLI